MAKEIKKITTVYARGREFYIIHDSEGKDICGTIKHYWGIESNNFDADGRLIKEINGIHGHLSESVAECVDKVMATIEIGYIQQTTGCTAMEAIEKYYESAIEA